MLNILGAGNRGGQQRLCTTVRWRNLNKISGFLKMKIAHYPNTLKSNVQMKTIMEKAMKHLIFATGLIIFSLNAKAEDFILLKLTASGTTPASIPVNVELGGPKPMEGKIGGKVTVAWATELNKPFPSIGAIEKYLRDEYCNGDFLPGGPALFEAYDLPLKLKLGYTTLEKTNTVSYWVRRPDGSGPFGYFISCR